jgi:hypothetical protein
MAPWTQAEGLDTNKIYILKIQSTKTLPTSDNRDESLKNTLVVFWVTRPLFNTETDCSSPGKAPDVSTVGVSISRKV